MAQKKLKVKNIRNVLESPFNINWSNANLEGAASLQKVLEELLPLAKLEKKCLNLHSKDKKKDNTRSSPSSVKTHNNIFRTYLTPGFQSVLRGLEKNELCCVLLSSDVSPPMIQRVVCGYCNAYGIPLIILPELKTITKSNLGFSTMVLGLKKIAESPENRFYPIYELVSQNPCIFEISFAIKQKDEIITTKKDQCIFRKDVSHVSSGINKHFHLYREKINERAFRPGTEADNKVSSQFQHSPKEDKSENFISFGKKEVKISEIKHLAKNIPNRDKSSDSDVDSMDEDNIFFVDNKPDISLMEAELPNSEGNSPQTNAEFERLGVKSALNKKTEKKENKVKTKNDRYFLSQVNKNTKNGKFKKKGKRVSKEQTADFIKSGSMEEMEIFTPSTFKPLKIKSIISNPKKIRRKKK